MTIILEIKVNEMFHFIFTTFIYYIASILTLFIFIIIYLFLVSSSTSSFSFSASPMLFLFFGFFLFLAAGGVFCYIGTEPEIDQGASKLRFVNVARSLRAGPALPSLLIIYNTIEPIQSKATSSAPKSIKNIYKYLSVYLKSKVRLGEVKIFLASSSLLAYDSSTVKSEIDTAVC